MCKAQAMRCETMVCKLLKSSVVRAQLMRAIGGSLTTAQKEAVGAILTHHTQKLHQGKSMQQVMSAFMKPIYARRAVGTVMGLEPQMPAPLWPTLEALLSHEPQLDKERAMTNNTRVTSGLSKWPLSWLEGRGVVCYERCKGRIDSEPGGRQGVPTLTMARALVKECAAGGAAACRNGGPWEREESFFTELHCTVL